MSKIQDALRRVQSTQRAPSTPSANASDSAVLARLERQRSKGDRDGQGDGKSIQNNQVVTFDQLALRNAGLLAAEFDQRKLADQYREVKRPLIAHAFGKRATQVENGKLIMISSALSGEGKTFTSINLALSISREKDHSALLVDADVAKPHISNILGVGACKGLLDLLEDENLHYADVILPTDIPGLSILPAGEPRHNATELLSSNRMETILEQLRNLSDDALTILDTPPLLQTSESKVLASLAGQIVLVVKAGKTPQAAVVSATEMLGTGQAVSLLLNQSSLENIDRLYGYHQGSAYGSSAGSPEPG